MAQRLALQAGNKFVVVDNEIDMGIEEIKAK